MSPYNSTVHQLLQNAGGVLLGKTNMDEFAMGSNNTTSNLYPPPSNPVFEDYQSSPRSTGGSSGGSAASVAANMCDFSLGSDTGGSVRLPAAYCGVVGFKPTYGLISRYGVVAYAQSLDTVGILSRDVKTAAKVFGILNKHDPSDPTSLSQELRQKLDLEQKKINEANPKRKYTIGILNEANLEDLDPKIKKAWLESLYLLQSQGHDIVTVSVPSIKQALPTYFIISPSEASSNLARYDGIRYGYRADMDRKGDILYAATRNEGFGKEVQRRILLGVFNLSSDFFGNHFLQAQKVRRKIQLEYDSIFSFPNVASHAHPPISNDLFDHQKTVDVIISPTSKTIAPTHKEIFNVDKVDGAVKSYVNDVLTVPASIAGLPAISIPWGTGSDTVGIQVIGQFGDDKTVLDVANLLEIR